jgi:hypothetical protein
MKNKDKKILFRVFTISDYEKEEKFLREQHKKGYKFVRFVFPGFYHFVKCEPEDVIYQLDLSDVYESDKSSYLQIFKDAGWHYMFDVMGWSYFRKPAVSDDGDNSIFSDKESKIALINRVFKTRMLPLLILFFVCIFPQAINQYYLWKSGNINMIWATGFLVFYCFVFLLYLYIFIHCGIGLARLRKQYKNGEK